MMRLLTIVEQNQILCHEWQGEIKALLVWCTIGLFLGIGIFLLSRAAWLVFVRHRKAGMSSLAFAAFAAYALLIARAGNDGSNKPQPVPSAVIRFDRGLYDMGSVATNDYPVIAWRYDSFLENDIVHISARPKASTNELDWIDYHVGPVSDTLWRGYIPACTGMVVWVWCEYIPPAPESTNGVYHLDFLAEPMDYEPPSEDVNEWVLLRTQVIDAEGGRLMSPPIIPQPLVDDFLNQTQQQPNHQETDE